MPGSKSQGSKGSKSHGASAHSRELFLLLVLEVRKVLEVLLGCCLLLLLLNKCRCHASACSLEVCLDGPCSSSTAGRGQVGRGRGRGGSGGLGGWAGRGGGQDQTNLLSRLVQTREHLVES